VLLSGVVDAMERHHDGVRFYIGHELGHLRMKHLRGHLLRWPALWLPLVGAAYARAKESTCDRHGLACSGSPEGAARALSALSAGPARWERLDVKSYGDQLQHSSGFWMSFHELLGSYPWLTKRVARVVKPESELPRRNLFAYVPAVFVPYAGRLGGGFGFLIMVYIVGVLAAVALPAYQDYTVRAQVNGAVLESLPSRTALAQHYLSTHQVPQSLEGVGIAPRLPSGAPLTLEPKGMVLVVHLKKGELRFVPAASEQDGITWRCEAGEGLAPRMLPASCRGQGGAGER
jgi:hypothetical protein